MVSSLGRPSSTTALPAAVQCWVQSAVDVGPGWEVVAKQVTAGEVGHLQGTVGRVAALHALLREAFCSQTVGTSRAGIPVLCPLVTGRGRVAARSPMSGHPVGVPPEQCGGAGRLAPSALLGQGRSAADEPPRSLGATGVTQVLGHPVWW